MPGLKTGVENAISWSKIWSGFGEPFPRSNPPLFPLVPQEKYSMLAVLCLAAQTVAT